MPTICTIGFRRKSLEEFIGLLREAGVDAVIDIRLRNTSQLAGYTKRADFDFLLREGFDIAYEHRPELAPTPEILDTYRDDKDWVTYERQFGPLMVERQMEHVADEIFARYERPCLLCSEITADKCHRRLVAEYWQKHEPTLEIVHV
ncbi:MAG: hypothetical protein MAG451_01229 [Anaerolineales bacterium]|nr:hypothetical protein [Anaerolineales bacterium]